MKKYILNVLDAEDGDIYYVLLFDDALELQRARNLIKKFDKEWYEYPDEFNTCDYVNELIKVLDENLVNYELPELENVYIR